MMPAPFPGPRSARIAPAPEKSSGNWKAIRAPTWSGVLSAAAELVFHLLTEVNFIAWDAATCNPSALPSRGRFSSPMAYAHRLKGVHRGGLRVPHCSPFALPYKRFRRYSLVQHLHSPPPPIIAPRKSRELPQIDIPPAARCATGQHPARTRKLERPGARKHESSSSRGHLKSGASPLIVSTVAASPRGPTLLISEHAARPTFLTNFPFQANPVSSALCFQHPMSLFFPACQNLLPG